VRNLCILVPIAWATLSAAAFLPEYPRVPRETVYATPETVAILKRFLASENPYERSEALEMLRQVRDPASAGDVRPLANDPDPLVRAQAILTLEAVLPANELVPVLEEKCHDPAPPVVRQSLGILGSMPGPEALGALLNLQESIAKEHSETWARALARRTESVAGLGREPPRDVLPVAVVQDLLGDQNPFVRGIGAQIVARQFESIDLARRLALLSDSFAQVRAQGIVALRGSAADANVNAAVRGRLRDSSSLVRRAAIECLDQAQPDLESITPLLEDVDPTVRIAAVRAIGHIGGNDGETRLIRMLGDREVLVAESASDQLGSIGGDRLAATLVGAFPDPREQVVRLSVRTLGLMKHAASLPSIQELVEHPSAPVRSAAYEAVGRMEDREMVPWLLERVPKESGYPRAAINGALGRLGDARALPHLLADCHYPDVKSKGIDPALFTPQGMPSPYPAPANAVATAAVRALGAIGDVVAVPALVEVSVDILRDEPFWTGVVTSLDRLGDPRAKPAFMQLGVVGEINQGMATLQMPATTRNASLRGFAHMRMTEVVDDILGIAPLRCVLEVRLGAAEVLTELTGEPYTYRLPVRQHEFFVDGRGTPANLSSFKLPICYRVNGSESRETSDR
jgi:HEAT repeat protein